MPNPTPEMTALSIATDVAAKMRQQGLQYGTIGKSQMPTASLATAIRLSPRWKAAMAFGGDENELWPLVVATTEGILRATTQAESRTLAKSNQRRRTGWV
jgi:hypothetical protein